MTRFAISVPVGAWHPFLPACLESLRCQDADLHVALMDASADPRVEALGDKHDDWLAYRHHGPDGGQSDAIQKGWAAVDSDWLGWLNADDILMPDALAKVLAKQASEPDLDIVYGHSSILDERGSMIGYHFNVEPPGERLLQAGIISQPSCFFSRAAYDNIGGIDPDRHYTMDWDLWLRLYASGARFGFLDDVLSMVLWGADTKTASLNSARRAELKSLIDKYAPDQDQKRTFRAFAIHALADRVWPEALRERIVRRLRRSGPRLFGLRADGQIDHKAILSLAHYDSNPKTGLRLEFVRPAIELQIDCDLQHRAEVGPDACSHTLLFEQPLAANVLSSITLRTDADPIYFKSATWLTDCA